MKTRRGRFVPAVHGVALLVVGLCVLGTRCPQQGPLYVDDFCWTSFEGLAADPKDPLRLGSFDLTNKTNQQVGVFLQPLEPPLTYGVNNNSFIIQPQSSYTVNVWTESPPTENFVADYTWLHGSALPFDAYNEQVEKFLGGHGGLNPHGGRATTLKIPVIGNVLPNAHLDDVRSLGDSVLDLGYGDMLANMAQGLKTGVKRPNSNQLILRRIPELHIEQVASIHDRVTVAPDQLFVQRGFKGNGVPFPCGAGANGLTVCPNMEAALPMGETDYVAVFQVLEADIPLDGATEFLSYSVVFESDDVDTNDWVPLPEFQNDFFQGTDRWYQAQYDPTTGEWVLFVSQVTDAANNVAQEVMSAARAIILGNTICFMIPLSELPAPIPEFRITAFSHLGDFGQDFPYVYSTDFAPGLDELMPVPPPVAF